MNKAARFLRDDRKAQEVKTLVSLIILVVFLLLVIGAIVLMWGEGNIFAGDSSICQQLGWMIGGCR